MRVIDGRINSPSALKEYLIENCHENRSGGLVDVLTMIRVVEKVIQVQLSVRPTYFFVHRYLKNQTLPA